MVKLLVFLTIFLGVIPLGVILARMYPVFRTERHSCLERN